MARLIDADELKKKSYKHTMISQSQADYGFEYEWDCIDIEDLEDAPTIDAERVKHGHWEVVNVGTSFYEERKCSCCKQIIKSNYWERCPNCGARMDNYEK